MQEFSAREDGKMCFSGYDSFTKETPYDLAKHSSIGCGGQAVAFFPHSVEEITALISRLQADKVSYTIIGNLSNVLPADTVKSVLVGTKKLTEYSIGAPTFVQAGVTSGKLLAQVKAQGFSGVEFLSGIPCTMGGALFMNAGAGGKCISESVESVLVLREGKQVVLSLEECGYAYKHSIFMENSDVILGGWLRLEKSSVERIEEIERYYIERRKHLPKGRSMGCVFKNPQDGFAGDLIERSGLKGFRVGGAKISEEHANFIINDRRATAEDILALIAIVKNAVYRQYGVYLEEEIRRIT